MQNLKRPNPRKIGGKATSNHTAIPRTNRARTSENISLNPANKTARLRDLGKNYSFYANSSFSDFTICLNCGTITHRLNRASATETANLAKNATDLVGAAKAGIKRHGVYSGELAGSASAAEETKTETEAAV